jgi:PAS domain S-box-containing protein
LENELSIANKELAFQNQEKEKRANELSIANKELAYQNQEKEKRADELRIANKELAFQNEEKEKRADELKIANEELVFQNEEKEKRADELIIANKELAYQNEEKEKRADELKIANKELVFQNQEKEKRAEELIKTKVLLFQNKEKEKRAAELVIAHKKLVFQNKLKEKQAKELIKAKEHAEESEERFRLLMLNMEAGIVVHSSDTSIILNNIRASEILGLSDDQMRGKKAIDPAWEFVKPDKSPLPFTEYPVNKIISSKEAIKSAVFGVLQPHKDDIVWVSVNGFPMLSNTGDITEIVISFIDITERKQIEEDKLLAISELKNTEKILNQTQRLAKVGSWLFHPLSQKVEWSDLTFEIWGLDSTKGNPEYDTLVELIHRDDLELFSSSYDKAINSGTSYDIEFRICPLNGEQKTLRSICQPVMGENGKVITLIGANLDVTPQKLLEETLVHHERLKAIGEMSSSIAHDFNNSLQGMMGNLEIIKFKNDLSGSTLERLNNIESIITDVTSRVATLQHFGDNENAEKRSELINFNTMIEDSLKQSRPLWKDNMEKQGLKVSVLTDFSDIPKVNCNRGELKSAIYNLIKNSMEAMPEGGDFVIKTGVKAEGVFATFTDSGIGMGEETKLKVFQPFYSTKGFKLGRGLGMSGVYSIIKKHKGDIVVKFSELGKGTTIEIVLPIGQQDEIKGIHKNESEPKGKESFHVLWVDDDTTILKNASELVALIGHNCDYANSGKSALKYLNKNTCDIVFTDIGMPEMNGWELAGAIRNKFGDKIKIVVVTGWDIDQDTKNKHDINFVLQKPFTLKELKKIFINLM